MSTPRARTTLPTVAAAAILLAGCNSSVGGTANPDPPSSSASRSTSANPFSSRNQCALLDQILTGKGFPKATPSVAQPQRSCTSQKPSAGTVRGMNVGLFLQEGRAYDDGVSNPGTARGGNVNKRPSIEQPEPLGTSGQCSITMAVAPQSRAILDVESESDTAGACQTAEDLATKLEPLLPPA